MRLKQTYQHRMSWCHHFEGLHQKQGDEREQMLKNVIANLSKQTSLNFSREHRKMLVWVVSKKD